MEKTKILPINTDQTQYLKQNVNNITILEQHKYIKILGILFSENMKEMIETNSEHTLQKMENHIRKLTPRNLSLYDKTILTSTLILAKTTFLSNILPIPEQVTQKIHKKIFQYIWYNINQEPIARKTLFLPINKGGLNLKETEAHNYAMRVKHLLTLKQKENKPAWMQIAIYWPAKDIYNYNKNYNHLKHNNIIKTNKITPFYYRELIYYIKTQNPKIPYLQTKTKEICNSILENGSKKHTIFEDKKWKEKIFTLDFSKISSHTANRKPKIYTTNFYITQLKQKSIFSN